MNARHFVKMLFVVLLLSPALLAQTLQVMPQPIQPLQLLPDLVPVDITLGEGCRIIVTLHNNGPGAVPNAGFSLSPPGSSGVQMYNDGNPWGGIVLGALDPAHAVQPAGGTVTYAWFPGLTVPPGSHAIRLDVDNGNTIVENNEVNNSLTKTLTCQLPDLQPISFTLQSTGITAGSPCQIIVNYRNNGPAAVPDSAYAQVATSPAVQMYSDGNPWGGVILAGVDPGKALQPAGGTLTKAWFQGTPNLFLAAGTHTLRIDVDNTNALIESNEGNNSLTQTVTCGLVLQRLQP
jgi:hypothetical protein